MRGDEARARLEAAAEWAAARGSLLFHLDLAAELGLHALREADLQGALHAVVVDGDGYGVVALDDGAVPAGKAIVRFAADGRPVVTLAAEPASRQIEALARARSAMAAANLAAGRQTVIVVPQAAQALPDDPIEAYAVALPRNAGDVVIGVHWRASVSADGRHVLSRDPLSRSELVLPGKGGQPAHGVEITHFGAVPNEMHTYLSLKHSLPYFVATLESGLVWSIDGERSRIEGTIDAAS